MAAPLAVKRYLNLAGSNFSNAGLSCFLLANLRKLDNVRLLKVTQHLVEQKKSLSNALTIVHQGGCADPC